METPPFTYILQQRLTHFASLEPGWHGGQGKTPSAATAVHARALLRQLNRQFPGVHMAWPVITLAGRIEAEWDSFCFTVDGKTCKVEVWEPQEKTITYQLPEQIGLVAALFGELVASFPRP